MSNRKRHDNRTDDIEFALCDCCATEYHERTEGLTFTAPDGRNSIQLCGGRCLELVADRLGMEREDFSDVSAEDVLEFHDFAQIERATQLEAVLSFLDVPNYYGHELNKVEDVAEFFDTITRLLRNAWEPYDFNTLAGISTFVDLATNERLFTEQEARWLMATFERARKVCKAPNDETSAGSFMLGKLADEAKRRAGLLPPEVES